MQVTLVKYPRDDKSEIADSQENLPSSFHRIFQFKEL